MTTAQESLGFPARKAVAAWLLVCCAMIFVMVVLGGVTRLTGSGLSMVEWKPVYGILPPLDQAQWEAVFEKYRQSPEYQKINIGMDLEGFKGIFWLEYSHRVLGRLIGIAFFVPLIIFLALRRVPAGLVPKLLIMFVLGGLQGLLGWYMVKSGLVDNPHVSQYRLAAHLLLAVLIYGYILWVALDLLFPKTHAHAGPRALKNYTYLLLGLVVCTIASGAFVAGLKAGLAYNTFPLMGERWVPEGLFLLEPWPRNLFENITTVQFQHRVLAILTFLTIVFLWLVARRQRLSTRVRHALHGLLIMGVVQVVLGISTLLLHVPVALAAIHQAGALVVFTISLLLAHQLRAPSANKRPVEISSGQIA